MWTNTQEILEVTGTIGEVGELRGWTAEFGPSTGSRRAKKETLWRIEVRLPNGQRIQHHGERHDLPGLLARTEHSGRGRRAAAKREMVDTIRQMWPGIELKMVKKAD